MKLLLKDLTLCYVTKCKIANGNCYQQGKETLLKKSDEKTYN